jgi:hypothetical protein
MEGGRLPQAGGVRPQLTVLVDLDSLIVGPGEPGWGHSLGALAPQACRRLACDGAVTRVLVTRRPTTPHDHQADLGGHRGPHDLGAGARLTQRLQAAMTPAPPDPGWGLPASPWTWGDQPGCLPAQRTALAVRDGACVFRRLNRREERDPSPGWLAWPRAGDVGRPGSPMCGWPIVPDGPMWL